MKDSIGNEVCLKVCEACCNGGCLKQIMWPTITIEVVEPLLGMPNCNG